MESKLSKGIVRILITNIINMMISILTSLILPKNLSVDTYAAIKTYQLYLMYVGILHFGFVDGIYLEYGGKDFKQINWGTIHTYATTFRFFQLLIVILGLLTSFLLQDFILMVVSIMVLPTNMLSFYKYLYQACGEYGLYSQVINAVAVATFIINAVLILIIRIDDHALYLFGYLIINILIWLFVEYRFQSRYVDISKPIMDISISKLLSNMKDGILLTLGNFASALTTSIDRWFVKIFMGTVGFAQYSFAVSMENFLNSVVTPVSITLYNTLCIDNSKESVKKYREYVILFATIIVAVAFPIKFITEIYLQKYYNSIGVVFLLFSSQIFYIVTKSIYVNLYKAQKRQDICFKKFLFVLIVGVILNVIAYIVYNVKESYALATAFTAICWFALVQLDFPDDRATLRELGYMMIAVIAFLAFGFMLKPIIGFIAYMLVIIVDMLIFMRKQVVQAVIFVKKNLAR